MTEQKTLVCNFGFLKLAYEAIQASPLNAREASTPLLSLHSSYTLTARLKF